LAKDRKYQDLNLELRDLSVDGFKVSILPSPPFDGSQGATPVQYKPDGLSQALDRLARKSIRLPDLYQLGKNLADLLLPEGQVRELFKLALSKAGQEGGVRLRLIIREPSLEQLPWEFAYLPLHASEDNRRHFLALNPQISIVRHEALGGEEPSLLGADPLRLRLIAVFANPAGTPDLDLEYEEKAVEDAVMDLNVDGVTVDLKPPILNATLDDLRTALLGGADLFHFAGHGGIGTRVDAASGETRGVGMLLLLQEKKTRAPYYLDGDVLAPMLQQAGVRVALLGACESGRQDGKSPWTAVAPALIERGVGAVIANQFAIRNDAATQFSKMFYTSLAAGLSVDEAVATARQAVLAISQEDGVEWGVPVLYMRSADGILFPKLAGRESKTAADIRRVIEQTVDTIEGGGEVVGIIAKRVTGGFQVTQKATTVKGRMVGAELDEL
jgi:CHAT domain